MKIKILVASVIACLAVASGQASASSVLSEKVLYGAPLITVPAYTGPGTVVRSRILLTAKLGVQGGPYDCSVLDDCFGVSSLKVESPVPWIPDFGLSVSRLKCFDSTSKCFFPRIKKDTFSQRFEIAGDLPHPVTFNLTWNHVGDVPPLGRVSVIAKYKIDPIPIPASLPLLAVGLGGLGLMARRKRKAA